MNDLMIPSPIDQITDAITEQAGIQLFVKRDDLIHPIISGNKWRKLKYNIEACKRKGYNTILSFGGSFSNHIHALAYVGKIFKINTIGVIRGEEYTTLNPTLSDARRFGMKLYYIDRESYRQKNSKHLTDKLRAIFGDFYMVPEGGANEEGFRGCMDIREEIDKPFDYICCAAGTGTTAAGLAASLRSNENLLVFPVLKGGAFLRGCISERLKPMYAHCLNKIHLFTDYHFGGYAKTTPDLMNFISNFSNIHKIPLEPVYTGKLFFGLYELIKNNYFKKGSTVIVLHTGGLQGNRGFLSE